VRVQMDTLSSPAHSGQFGGAAPDAVKALMRALDSLYDETGATVIEGTDSQAKWEGRSYPAEDFRKDARLLEGTEIAGGEDTNPGDLVWARPSVTVTGFTSTPVDRAVRSALMRALDSLYDETGATVIEGTDSQAKWEGRSYPAEDFRKDARLLEGTEIAGGEDTNPGDLVWARPSVTVTGFTSTPVDRAVNAV